MRVSINWLKKYVDINVPTDELVRIIGARLVEVEGTIDETHKYDNIYVVRVEKAEKIPDTHLTLCQINNGKDELVQVVCGAPNVREGMLAAWIAPGAIVPASVNEDAPFVIGKRKMLGKYDSNGMLAGADELDFGDDHSGIVEIEPGTAEPGTLLADVFELRDVILDIENKSLTHRPDCFGIIGFAREVAGILGQKFIEPEMATKIAKKKTGGIEIKIEDNEICRRYSAMILEKHGEFKQKYLSWQDTILAKSGMRPVDKIVDVTNYLMLLTGQPLHAFDYDKFVSIGGMERPEVVVRLAQDGEKLVLLDGKEVELNRDDIVICSGNIPVALAGAMGGQSTAVDSKTRNIILESATFSLYNLRKTQMSHGIFSEAITRFTKGQPEYQTVIVAEKCAEMLSDGFREVALVDKYPEPRKISSIEISIDEINALLGTDYDAKLIVKTLENVGFEIKKRGNLLNVLAPEWRTDIHIKEDVIEEVGRLLGYDNIKPVLPRHLTADRNKLFDLENKVRDVMKEFGANEVLTYSFVSERLLRRAGVAEDNSYKIVNSISPNLQYVRQSIVPSLLDKAYMNQKMPVDKFAIFEINRVYQKDLGMNDEGVPVEKNRIGCVIAERKNGGTAYYFAKMLAEKMLERLNIQVRFVKMQDESVEGKPFEPKRAAEIWSGEEYVGVVGEFKNSVRRNFKLGKYLSGFELDFDAILRLARPTKEIKNFDIKDKQDITVKTDETYAEALAKLSAEYPDAQITPIGIYQSAGKKEKNITFHLEARE